MLNYFLMFYVIKTNIKEAIKLAENAFPSSCQTTKNHNQRSRKKIISKHPFPPYLEGAGGLIFRHHGI